MVHLAVHRSQIRALKEENENLAETLDEAKKKNILLESRAKENKKTLESLQQELRSGLAELDLAQTSKEQLTKIRNDQVVRTSLPIYES